jgi:murein DD-endopeptidase MepM/ murein hydrolase activator NlpD
LAPNGASRARRTAKAARAARQAKVASAGISAIAAAAGAPTGGVGAIAVNVARRIALEKALELALKHKDITAALLLLPAAFVFCVVFFSALVFTASLPKEKGFLGGSPSAYATAEIPPGCLQIFLAAQREYGVAWNVLAAVAKVESSFGANMGPSSQGAVGFMQFMPTTWSGSANPYARDDPRSPAWDTDPERIKQYGGYGTDADGDGRADPFNPWDAVFAAAKFLKANGFDADVRRALWQYNHADWYVARVLEAASSYSFEMLPGAAAKCLPVPKGAFSVSSPFGYRPDPFTGQLAFHEGIDIPAPEGTPVFAVDAGRVTMAGWSGGYGLAVIIDHGSCKTLYGHLSEKAVSLGSAVEAGQVIGAVGSSGRSTGAHLHFGVSVNGKWCNPEEYLGVLAGKG